MPSAGFLSLLCSCLLGSQAPDARLAIAAVSAQSPIAAPLAVRAQTVISPSYLSAISGHLVVVPTTVAEAAQSSSVVVPPSTTSGAAPLVVPAPDYGTTSVLYPTANATPSVEGAVAGGAGNTPISTVFLQPVLRYTNIPLQLLDATNPTDRVAAVISSNEGRATSIDWNDQGHGVSVGIFQANQRVGELPELLHQFAVLPQGQQQIACAFGTQKAAQIQQNPEVIRKWHFSPKNSLGKGLQKIVHSNLFQKFQVAILRHKVNKAAEVAANYGITSTAGVAVCADLTNQWGRAGAKRFLKAADAMQSQGGKVSAIVMAVSKGSQYGSRYQQDLQKVQGDELSLSERFVIEPAYDTVVTSFNP